MQKIIFIIGLLRLVKHLKNKQKCRYDDSQAVWFVTNTAGDVFPLCEHCLNKVKDKEAMVKIC